MVLFVIAKVATPFGAVVLSPKDKKMPLPVFEPESTTPFTPIVLLLIVPLRLVAIVEPATGVAICSTIVLPLASRKLLPDTLKVIPAKLASFNPKPPMVLNAWVFDTALFWKMTSIVTDVVVLGSWPVKFTTSPGEPVKVDPVTVVFKTVPLADG